MLLSKGSAVGCGSTRWKLIQSQQGGRWQRILQVVATISNCHFSAQTCIVFWFQMASFKHLGLGLILDRQGCWFVLRSGAGTRPLHNGAWGLSLDAVKLGPSWDRSLTTLVLFLCFVPGRPFCFSNGLRLEKRQLAIVSHGQKGWKALL